MNHRPDRFTIMHELEGIIDFIQRHGVGHKRLQLDFAIHSIFDHTGQLCTPFHSPKRGTFPYAAGNQLERTGGNLLSGPSYSNDN
ncbi:hypothetical protein SME06J_35210 [Serratia marcescens]|nr:hypothetical protein SME06J_35210 [Serratia marcescens]